MPDTSDLQELSREGKLRESYSLLKKKISLSHELIQKYNDAVMETDRVKKELSISEKKFAKVSTNNNMSMAKNIELQLENNKLKKTVEILEKDLANANIKVSADKKHLQQLNDKVKHLDSQLECLKIEEALKQKELTDTIAELKKQVKVPKEKKTLTESSSQTDSIQKKRYRDVATVTEASKIEPCKCSTNDVTDDHFKMKQILSCQVCTRSIDSTLCSLCELEYKLSEGLVPPIVDMIEESLQMESTVINEEERAPTPITHTRDESCQMNKIKSDKEDLHTLVQEMQRKIDLMEKKQRKIMKINKSKNHSCCHQNSPNVSQSFVSPVPANFSFMNDFCTSMFEGYKQHLANQTTKKRKRKASPIVKINKFSCKRAKLNTSKWIESPSSDCAESPQEYQGQPSSAKPQTSTQEVSHLEMESLIMRKNDENWMELNSQVDEDSTKRLMEDFEKDQNCASTPKSTKSPIQVNEPTYQKNAKKLEPIEDRIQEEPVSQQEKNEALQCSAPILPEEDVPAVDIAPEPSSPLQFLTQNKLKKEIDPVEREPQVEQENPTEDPPEVEEQLGFESIPILDPTIQPSIPIVDPTIQQLTPIVDPIPQTVEPPEIKINTEQLKRSPDNSAAEDPEPENNLTSPISPISPISPNSPTSPTSPTSPPPAKVDLFNDLFGEESISNKAKPHSETDSSRSETSYSDSESESAIKSEDKMDCGKDDFESPQSPDGFEPNDLPIVRKVQNVYPIFDETSSQTESEINEPEQPGLSLKARLAQTFINFQKSSDENTDSDKQSQRDSNDEKAESSGGKGKNGRVTLNRKIDRQKSIISKLRKLKTNPPVLVAAKPKSDPIPPDVPKRPILPEVIDYNPKKQRIAHSKDPKNVEVTSAVKKPHIAILSVETIPKMTAIKLIKSKTDDNPDTETTSPALVTTILKDMEQSFKDVPKTQKKCFDLRNMYTNKDDSPVDEVAEKVESETVIEKVQNKTVEDTVEKVASKSRILTRSKADENESRSSTNLQTPVKKVDNSVKNVSSPVKKVPGAKKNNEKSTPLAESYSDMICNESFGVPRSAESSKELRTRKVPVKARGAAFIDGIPNSLKKQFPDPNIEKGPVPSVMWMLNNYFLDEFKTPRGLRKRAPIEWRKIKYAEGQIKRLIDDKEWTMTVHNSVIENLVEHCTSDFIINGILNYLCSIEQVEEKDLSFTPPAPIMTKTQQKIVTLINCLEPHFPTIFKETQAAIEFSLFRLNCAPSNEKIELLSVLFVALARVKKDRAKVRMFCVDALYCYNLKAVVVIHCALRNWPEVLPIYGTMDDKLALCIMMIIMNMNNPCGSYPKLRNLKQLITLHYQYPTGGISSADFVQQCFVDLLNHPEKHTAINTALILLSKKESHEWSYKNIITGGLLQSIINKTHPSTYAAYDLLGCILRSFPTTDSDNVVRNIIEQLCDLLDAAEGPHHEQESIARALLSLSRHDFFKVAKSIVKWKPTEKLRPDTINKLECFFHFQPMERWRIFILNDYVPFSKRSVSVKSGAKI